jgi:uncharacterized protein (TIGR02246 family)
MFHPTCEEVPVPGTREEAKAIVESIVAAYNAKDVAALAPLYHSDARYWSALGDWQEGLPAITAHIEELHRTLPDEQMETLAVMSDGEVVVAEFRSTGTSPNGTPYTIEFTEVIEIREGRIASVKVYLDPEEVGRVMG